MGERGARWAGRVAALLGVAVLAYNAVWIAAHWDHVRPVAPGDLAPPFTLPRADGTGEVALAELRGKVVLVDFWATWCKPCRASMPAIERVYKRFRNQGLEVLSVNTEGLEGRAAALALAAQLGVSFPIVVDDGSVAAIYRVTTIPHMVLIDRRGVVVDVHRGVSSGFEAHLAEEVERLMRAR